MKQFFKFSLRPFKFYLVLFISILFSNISIKSQSIGELIYDFAGIDSTKKCNENEVYNVEQKLIIKNFWNTIKQLDTYERLESKVRGETIINFDTDRSNNQGLFRLNV